MKNKKSNRNKKPFVKSNLFIGILIGIFALLSGTITVLILRFIPAF